MKKKCLVTGAAGFIGSHLVDALLQLDYDVIAVDNMYEGDINNLKHNIGKCIILLSDFADDTVLNLVEKSNLDYVFHLAARPKVPDSIENTHLTHVENVEKTLKLLDACVIGNVQKFIFSSSAAVYGDSEELPTKESSIISPQSPYGLQKLMVEQYLYQYKMHKNLNSVSLRYSNVFGPRQNGNGAYANVLSKWFLSFVKDPNMPLPIYGNGEQSRDFVHVFDVVKANILAAKINVPNMVFNVSSNTSISINTLSEITKIVCGNGVKFEYKEKRPGDPLNTLMDNSLIKEKFGIDINSDNFLGNLEEMYKWYESSYKQ